MGESNSRHQFGKLELYHLTNPAKPAFMLAEGLDERE